VLHQGVGAAGVQRGSVDLAQKNARQTQRTVIRPGRQLRV
jgi:hypothetical protein